MFFLSFFPSALLNMLSSDPNISSDFLPLCVLFLKMKTRKKNLFKKEHKKRFFNLFLFHGIVSDCSVIHINSSFQHHLSPLFPHKYKYKAFTLKTY